MTDHPFIATRIAAWALKRWPNTRPEDLFIFQRPCSDEDDTHGTENIVQLTIGTAQPFCISYGWWLRPGLGEDNRSVGVEFSRNHKEDTDIGLRAQLLGLHLFVNLRWQPHTERFRSDPETHGFDERQTYLRLNYAGSWITAGIDSPAGRWSRDDPWWQDMTLSPRHLWGRNKSQRTVLASGETLVPMPEGDYPAKWTHERVTLSYTKVPGKIRDKITGNRSWESFDIEIPGGIPVWGKGENSWDCGMDGVFGVSGKSLDEAILNAVESGNRDRDRYGSIDLPRPMTLKEAETHLRTAA